VHNCNECGRVQLLIQKQPVTQLLFLQSASLEFVSSEKFDVALMIWACIWEVYSSHIDKVLITVTSVVIFVSYSLQWGTAIAQWLRCCATNRKVAGSIPAGVSGFFIDIKSFRSHYGPGVDSASNRNEYQEYFLGVKTAGA